MANQLPQQDQALRAFVVNFHDQCAGNLTVLGLTSGQITALNDKLLDFDTSITTRNTKREEAIGATLGKDAAKQALLEELRPLIRIIRGHDVPAALLGDLGIGVVDPSHPVAPEPPGTISVDPYANGTNWVKWQRGTNKPKTTYVVEVMNANSNGWQIIASVSRLSFKHTMQEPGFQQSYRVRAVRKGVMGIPSFPATVYGPEQSGEVVTLKAA